MNFTRYAHWKSCGNSDFSNCSLTKFKKSYSLLKFSKIIMKRRKKNTLLKSYKERLTRRLICHKQEIQNSVLKKMSDELKIRHVQPTIENIEIMNAPFKETCMENVKYTDIFDDQSQFFIAGVAKSSTFSEKVSNIDPVVNSNVSPFVSNYEPICMSQSFQNGCESIKTKIKSNTKAELLSNNVKPIVLTMQNVKTILQQILSNQECIDMVRDTIESESMEDELKKAIFEPKMTRNKVKEIIKNGVLQAQKLNQYNESMPPAFIEMNFSDSDNDDDYDPNREVNDSGDESSIFSLSMSEHGTPPSQTSDASSHEPHLNSACKKLFTDISYEEEATIAVRTRSKLPLHGTSISELEANFIAPDITYDMYDFVDDCDTEFETENKYWREFLARYSKDELNETHDDEENDPEYNFRADLEVFDADESKFNRTTEISKEELNDLMESLNEILESCESSSPIKEYNYQSNNNNSIGKIVLEEAAAAVKETIDKNFTDGRPVASIIQQIFEPTGESAPTTVDKPVLNVAEFLQLQYQMRIHVQLLAQFFVMSSDDTLFEFVSQHSSESLKDIHYRAMNSNLPIGVNSVFNPPNLDYALSLSARKPCRDDHLIKIENYLHNKLKKKQKSTRFKPFSLSQMEILCDDKAFIFPELLPLRTFDSKCIHNISDHIFSDTEILLLESACNQFRDINSKAEKIYWIKKIFFPFKSEQYISNRITHLSSRLKHINAKKTKSTEKSHIMERFIELEPIDEIVSPIQRPIISLPFWAVELKRMRHDLKIQNISGTGYDLMNNEKNAIPSFDSFLKDSKYKLYTRKKYSADYHMKNVKFTSYITPKTSTDSKERSFVVDSAMSSQNVCYAPEIMNDFGDVSCLNPMSDKKSNDDDISDTSGHIHPTIVTISENSKCIIDEIMEGVKVCFEDETNSQDEISIKDSSSKTNDQNHLINETNHSISDTLQKDESNKTSMMNSCLTYSIPSENCTLSSDKECTSPKNAAISADMESPALLQSPKVSSTKNFRKKSTLVWTARLMEPCEYSSANEMDSLCLEAEYVSDIDECTETPKKEMSFDLLTPIKPQPIDEEDSYPSPPVFFKNLKFTPKKLETPTKNAVDIMASIAKTFSVSPMKRKTKCAKNTNVSVQLFKTPVKTVYDKEFDYMQTPEKLNSSRISTDQSHISLVSSSTLTKKDESDNIYLNSKEIIKSDCLKNPVDNKKYFSVLETIKDDEDNQLDSNEIITEENKVCSWSKSDDFLILQSCRNGGTTDESFANIASILEDKTLSDVQKRFYDLMSLYKNL